MPRSSIVVLLSALGALGLPERGGGQPPMEQPLLALKPQQGQEQQEAPPDDGELKALGGSYGYVQQAFHKAFDKAHSYGFDYGQQQAHQQQAPQPASPADVMADTAWQEEVWGMAQQQQDQQHTPQQQHTLTQEAQWTLTLTLTL